MVQSHQTEDLVWCTTDGHHFAERFPTITGATGGWPKFLDENNLKWFSLTKLFTYAQGPGWRVDGWKGFSNHISAVAIQYGDDLYEFYKMGHYDDQRDWQNGVTKRASNGQPIPTLLINGVMSDVHV